MRRVFFCCCIFTILNHYSPIYWMNNSWNSIGFDLSTNFFFFLSAWNRLKVDFRPKKNCINLSKNENVWTKMREKSVDEMVQPPKLIATSIPSCELFRYEIPSNDIQMKRFVRVMIAFEMMIACRREKTHMSNFVNVCPLYKSENKCIKSNNRQKLQHDKCIGIFIKLCSVVNFKKKYVFCG